METKRKRKVYDCVNCKQIKEIIAKKMCNSCYRYTRLRENPRALELRRISSLKANRKISGIPFDAPKKKTSDQRIINNSETWAIQYLLDLGYEIRKPEKQEQQV